MRTAILSSILMFCIGLQAQYTVTDGSGNVLTNGSGYRLVTAGPVHYVTQTPAESEFLIVADWDYTGLSLGAKTIAEMKTYYDAPSYFESDYTEYNQSIVEETINGSLDTCLRIKNYDDELAYPLGMWGSGGYSIIIDIDTSMRECFMTYYVKFDLNFRLEGDSKMSGFHSLRASVSSPYPMPDAAGWNYKIQLKQAGTIDTYNYDRSDGVAPWTAVGFNPWAFGYPDTIAKFYQGSVYDKMDFITYGSWHKVDIRMKMNTWVSGTAQRDGLMEVALDDTIVFQMDGTRMHEVDLPANLIEGIYLGQFENVETSGTDFYSYIDKVIGYVPINDPLLGEETFHTTMWDSPSPIPTDDYYSDSIIDIDTEDITMSSSGSWETYMWIIDAGVGNKTTISWNSGDVASSNMVAVFDGKTAGAPILAKYSGVADMSGESNVVSTGQFTYVYLVSGSGGGIDLSGDIAFSPQ